jgi:ribosomal protein S18 acetylase RimI-like enzyme
MRRKAAVRLGQLSDAAVLAEFNRAMALETEGKDLPLEGVQAGVETLLKNPNLGFYVVATREGKIAGSLMVTTEWSDWRNGSFWWIQSVYVRPELRRSGIFRDLYAFVRTCAANEPDVCGFRLYVERENTGARKTYETLGMQEMPYRMYEAPADRGSPG